MLIIILSNNKLPNFDEKNMLVLPLLKYWNETFVYANYKAQHAFL